MLERAARLPLERPCATVIATLLLTLLLAPSLLQVSFQTDVEAFLPDSEAARQHERVELLFGRESKVAQLYVTPTNGNNTLTMEALLEIQELHWQAAQLEGVRTAVSVSSFFDSALREKGTSLEAISLSDCPWDEVYSALVESEGGNYSYHHVTFITDVLVHRDLDMISLLDQDAECRDGPIASAALVLLNLDPELTTPERKQVGQQLRQLAQEWEGEQVRAEAFSVDLLAYDVDQTTSHTNLLMGGGMLLVSTLLLWYAFRHWSYVLLPLVTLLLALTWTFSFAGLTGMRLTAIDVAVLPLVAGLGIDFAVHMSRRYQEELALGRRVPEALWEAQWHTGRALALAMLTTVIAFLSGVTAGVGPIRDFSLLCAAGITSAFLLTLTFHTASRLLLDTRLEAVPTHPGAEVVERAVTRAAMAVESRPVAILAVVAVVTLLALAGASRVDTSFSLDDFLSEELEVMVTAEKIRTDFRGASYSQSQVLVEGNVTRAGFLDELAELESGQPGSGEWGMSDDTFVIKLGGEPMVESVRSVVTTAIAAEPYALAQGGNPSHEWQRSQSFRVPAGEMVSVTWEADSQRASLLSLEVTLHWQDEDGNALGNDTEHPSGSSLSFQVPANAARAQLEFSHLRDPESSEALIANAAVRGDSFVWVQSLQHTFHLTEEGGPFGETSSHDVRELYDYLYQRDLELADPFTNLTYAARMKQVLYRDAQGEYSAAVVRVFIGPTVSRELDNHALEQMISDLEQDLPDRGFAGAETSLTGGHVLTVTTIDAIQSTQLKSTLLSVALAMLLLVAIYRHFGLGLLNVLPVGLATIWILGSMAVLSITLNVMTVMVTALTVGLGIDYAIHIIERYREELARRSEQGALEVTIHQTGSALLISGLTTVGGFAVLLLSPMPLVRNFGLLTALTIVYAVLIALLVLPSLLWAGNRVAERLSRWRAG
ncbi:MAG: MMPL family transporter [Candidatus Poseidoniia archaeon]|nr:MMPL family transporter [Candidatus Poseidoniia archaeon]